MPIVRSSMQFSFVDRFYPHLEILLLIVLYALYPRSLKVFQRVTFPSIVRAHLIPVSIRTKLQCFREKERNEIEQTLFRKTIKNKRGCCLDYLNNVNNTNFYCYYYYITQYVCI